MVARRAITLTLSPAHGWALLAPYGLGLGHGTRLITSALLFALVLPLGYWAGAARGGSRAAAALGTTLILGLAASRLQGAPPVQWSEWLAVTTAAAGWASTAPRLIFNSDAALLPTANPPHPDLPRRAATAVAILGWG
jgi:hypothetical protein